MEWFRFMACLLLIAVVVGTFVFWDLNRHTDHDGK